MCRKLIYLVSFVSVLSITMSVVRADLTEGLVGYWPLDGDALDASGNGNDGVIMGNVTPTTDRFGTKDSAMNFPGSTSDYIDLGQPPMLLIKGAMTVAAWVRADTMTQNGRILAKQGPSSGRSWSIQLESGGDFARFDVGINPTDRVRADSEPLSFGPDEWFHIAGVFRPGEAVEIYINGELANSEPTTVTTQWIENGLPVNIGRRPQPGTPWQGDIDEVQMYNIALTPEEIQSLMSGRLLSFPKARGPSPADGALHVDTWVNLSWSPGDSAVSHDVYLGDSFDDVNDGAEGVFLGNQSITSLLIGFPGFPYPDGLASGTTYYWRIDEVNDADPNSPWKGDIWSFKVPSSKAHDPDPPDDARYVSLNPTLTWTSGMDAKLHYVYFGENPADVESGADDTYKGSTGTAGHTTGTLVKDTVYYWRVDEFDGIATHTGDVWSFTTVPEIPITDPDLMGWWKLDEGHGTTAFDWSGHGNDGALQGDPQWITGYDGDSLQLDGSSDNIYAESAQLPTGAFTLALWFNSGSALNDSSPRKDFLYWQVGNGRPHLTFNRSGTGEIGLWPNVGGDVDGPLTTTRSWAAGTWYHIASTFDGTSFKIYVNGNLENVVNHPGTHDDASGLLIGCRTNQRNYFDGKIDDVRLYSKALTQQEISLVMRGDPLVAWGPNPANGSTPYIREATPLSWSPGDNASQHDVYFGTDRDAVADANESDTTGIYRGRQSITIYTPPDVEWGGGPYYWRVDEYNTDATISEGKIWSFTVTDYIGIDDIEDYNDYPPDEIFSTWIDGWEVPTNGSLAGHTDPPFAETGNVHGGSQSMPVYYENNFKYSEITMTLVYPRNWTEEGVGVLSLWFYGDAANAAERMYVNLNGIATVYHNDPSVAQIATWTEWTIDLQEFAAQGVNLANVNTISIGFGDKNNLQAGGSGMVLFDDIRLYRPAPEPELAP